MSGIQYGSVKYLSDTQDGVQDHGSSWHIFGTSIKFYKFNQGHIKKDVEVFESLTTSS
jgi:hypothetical protein